MIAMATPTLFDETRIKGMTLRNRLVRSATFEGMADDGGRPTPALTRLYVRLAKGGIGLLITGYAYVAFDGKSPFPGMLAIDRDELIPDYRALVDEVHRHGAAIAMQIAHCGRQTSAEAVGGQPMAPSPVKDRAHFSKPRAMTEDEIERVLDQFAAAAGRARAAGFDAVQIHGAHGYLVNQFLSPHTNRRRDRWGGSLENRMRFVTELCARCRRAVGDDYPLLIKISAEDEMKRGLRLAEGVVMARKMAEMGFDGIEVSCGIAEDGLSTLRGEVPIEGFLADWPMYRAKNRLYKWVMRRWGRRIVKPPALTHGFNRAAAVAMRAEVKVPLFLVGGLTDPTAMAEIIASGDVDYLSLSRALIADARFPAQIAAGHTEPSPCTHCNLCSSSMAARPLRCYRGRLPRPNKRRQQAGGTSGSASS